MTTLITGFDHVKYEVTRALVISESKSDNLGGCKRICATEIDGDYPKGQEWRGDVMFTRFADGWQYSSNNLGTFIKNPEQVAFLDKAWEDKVAEDATKA